MNEKKRIEKEKKRHQKEQRRAFVHNIDRLFQTEYRYSKRFEKAHVYQDGKAYINVDLTKVDTPFSVYSYDTRIDQEIYDYIDNEVFYLAADIPLVVNFDDDGKYTEAMKDKIAKAVVRHYALQYEDKRKELSKNNITAFIILTVGLIVLITYIALSFILSNNPNFNSMFIEVLLIMSWMFIWEAGNRFFFSGSATRREVFNAGQLALVEVRFGKPIVR